MVNFFPSIVITQVNLTEASLSVGRVTTLRPALTADNSGRGNDFYNQSPTSYDPGKLGNNDYRGIAARIIFYCAVKYQHEGLKLVDLTSDSTSNKSMGKLSTLLEWNLQCYYTS